MNCNMLTNEQLLEKAVLSFETLEYRDETLDRLRAERDALLAEADLRINAETSHRKETEAEHQEVMQELARRMIAAFMTGLPSSEMATQPVVTSSPISASCSPCSPLEMAPMGYTFTTPSRRARSWMNSVTDWLSLTGLVLAMQQMLVKPPRAAARVPVAMVSMSSRPGSRR